MPIEILAAVDHWPVACSTYSLNHPGVQVLCRDLRDPETLELLRQEYTGVDLVLGGIPCEWLSVRRNVGNPVTDEERAQERATLAAALTCVRDLRPRWWCLEDVAGIVPELPPGTPWISLDSSAFSAQRRRRVYVGWFPRPTGHGPLLQDASARVLRDCLRPGPYRIGARSFGRTPQTHRTFSPRALYGCRPGRKSPTICCLSSRRDAELVILDPAIPGGMRQLEWQEAAALQGFPPDYLFYGSPTDVWNQIGPAIQIDTGRAILEAICEQAGVADRGRAKAPAPEAPQCLRA